MVLQIGFTVVDAHRDQLFPHRNSLAVAICVKARAAETRFLTKSGHSNGAHSSSQLGTARTVVPLVRPHQQNDSVASMDVREGPSAAAYRTWSLVRRAAGLPVRIHARSPKPEARPAANTYPSNADPAGPCRLPGLLHQPLARNGRRYHLRGRGRAGMPRQFGTTSAGQWTCWGQHRRVFGAQLIADRPDVVRKAVVASAAYALGPVGKEEQLKLLHAIEETGRYPAHAVLDAMSGKLRSRWLRALLTPVALVAAKRITIENPADTIAMLRAEDAFDVRDRLPGYPD